MRRNRATNKSAFRFQIGADGVYGLTVIPGHIRQSGSGAFGNGIRFLPEQFGQRRYGGKKLSKAQVRAYAFQRVGGPERLFPLVGAHGPAKLGVASVVQKFGNEPFDKSVAGQPLLNLGKIAAQRLVAFLNRHIDLPYRGQNIWTDYF